jgi:predicted nucleic acid-binding protein
MERLTSKPIIADSSGLVSLAISDDSNHQIALASAKQLQDEHRPLIVPSEIFSETVNIIGRQSGHPAAMGTANILLDEDSSFLYHQTSRSVLDRALKQFVTVPGSVSFTDCIVMAFADEYQTKEIFGFDKAFETAGYTTLMPSKR